MRAFLAVLLIVPPAYSGPARARFGGEGLYPEARFKIVIPPAWSEVRAMGKGELGNGASGVVFKSMHKPRMGGEPRVVIVFYATGNPHFNDAADFLARQSDPLPATPGGERVGPVTETMLGPLKARVFERFSSNPIRGEYVIAADGEGGFYTFTGSGSGPGWMHIRGHVLAFKDGFSPLEGPSRAPSPSAAPLPGPAAPMAPPLDPDSLPSAPQPSEDASPAPAPKRPHLR